MPTDETNTENFIKNINKTLHKEIDGMLNPKENIFTKYVKRPFYHILHEIGLRYKLERLSSWSYLKLYSTYPCSGLGYWRFAADYLRFNLGDIMNKDGKIEISH